MIAASHLSRLPRRTHPPIPTPAPVPSFLHPHRRVPTPHANHINELCRRHDIRLHLVANHSALFERVGEADELGFAPGRANEADAESMLFS